jgi:hypothetical protein
MPEQNGYGFCKHEKKLVQHRRMPDPRLPLKNSLRELTVPISGTDYLSAFDRLSEEAG